MARRPAQTTSAPGGEPRTPVVCRGGVQPAFTLRYSKMAVEAIGLAGGWLRAFVRGGDGAVVIDVDPVTGSESGRSCDIEAFTRLHIHPRGFMLGVFREPRVGDGPARLVFFDEAGAKRATGLIPDAPSHDGVVCVEAGWYVGCRAGGLHAFDRSGRPRWTWIIPGSRGTYRSPYFRPCPYHVQASGRLVVASSMNNLYALDHHGRCLWSAELGAAKTDVEAVMEDRTFGRLLLHAPPAYVSSLAAQRETVMAGTTGGNLFIFDHAGRQRAVHRLGGSSVAVARSNDGGRAAVLHAGVVSVLDGEAMAPGVRVGEWAHNLCLAEGGLLVWGRLRLEVISPEQILVGSLTFDRPIAEVIAQADMVIVRAGGAVFGFKVSGD